MKKYIFIVIATVLLNVSSFSQSFYFTKSGNITFLSETLIENIKADNNQVVSFLKPKSGELNFGVLIKSFKFKNALMEEHFNENYLESDKFSKAKFKGKITNLDEIDFNKKGTYNAKIAGKLSIHGITKSITTTAKIEVTGKIIIAKAKIDIKPEDYNIQIPDIVKDKIAEKLEVKINIKYEPYKK